MDKTEEKKDSSKFAYYVKTINLEKYKEVKEIYDHNAYNKSVSAIQIVQNFYKKISNEHIIIAKPFKLKQNSPLNVYKQICLIKNNTNNVATINSDTNCDNVSASFGTHINIVHDASTDESNIYYFSIEKKWISPDSKRLNISVLGCNANTGDTYRNIYYASNTGGGYLRYCSIEDDQYVKGINYVVTTMINIDLQKYIFDNINYHDYANAHEIHIPSISYDYNERKGSCIDTCIDFFNSGLYKRFKQTDHVVNDYFMRAMDHFDNNGEELAYNNVKHMINSIPDKRTNISSYDIMALYYLKNKLNEMNFINKYDIAVATNGDMRPIYVDFKKGFEYVFSLFFMICTKTKQEMFKNQINMLGRDIISTIFNVVAISKLSGEKFIIYYACYDYQGDAFKNIIYMKRKHENISIHGLDVNYCKIGIFINKIFEYSSQIPNVKDYKEDVKNKQDDDNKFIFIGDLTSYDFLP